MAHQALARKYRPRRFADVAAQQHVSETLRRAVAGGRVAHAYLFCGPRGVGKTSLARMLAMALNCPKRGEDGEPCGTCESCTRIWSGHTALDVVEIDAASNRGVDDARDLRERAMYAPSEEGRFKVYIVDEAHMLTREAWNALLKILEEPPPRVIFVFATTEPQKIQQAAAPILSRCQRFDFRRVGVSDIVARLAEVLEAEGASAPEDALRILARKADGGMRDGLSLLDQVLSLTGGDVDQESVRRILGLVEEERYLELMDIVREGRHGAVFGFVEELLDEGYDLAEFYHGLVDALRALLRVSLSGPDEVPELREDLRGAFAERAGSFSSGDLVRMLAMASELESTGSLRRSAQPRMLLEMLLLRLSYLDRTVELEDLIRGLGGAPRGAPPGSGEDRGGPVEKIEAPRRRKASSGGGATVRTEVPTSPRSVGTAPSGSGVPGEAGGAPGTAGGGASTAGQDVPGPAGAAAVAPAFPSRPSEPSGSVGSATPELADAWEAVLGEDVLPPGLRPLLRAGRVTRGEEGVVRLRLPPGPALERLHDPAARRALADALEKRLEERVQLEVRGSEGNGGTGRITRESVRQDRLKELVAREPLLERAVEELDLELLE